MSQTIPNIAPVIWYTKNGPLAQMYNNAKGDILYLANEYKANGTRKYASFKTVQAFVKTYDIEAKNNNFHEIVHSEHLLFFDFDFKKSDYKIRPLIKAFIKLLHAHFKSVSLPLNEKDIRITNSSNRYKGSLHAVILGRLFRNVAETRAFVQSMLKLWIDNKSEFDTEYAWADIIDMNVYTKNHNMRIIGSAKVDEPARILKPISIKGRALKKFKIEEYFITPSQQYYKFYYATAAETMQNAEFQEVPTDATKRAITLYSNEDDSLNHNLEAYTTDQTHEDVYKVKFKRLTASHCELCDRTHTKDNSAYLLVCPKDNNIFLMCFKSKKNRRLGNITEKEEEEIEDEKKPQLSKIRKAINQVKKRSISYREKLIKRDFLNIGCKVNIYDSEYCSNNDDLLNSTAVIIGQRASMGCGKSYAEALRVKMKFNDINKRVLIISFRISLSKQMRNGKFKNDPFIKTYLEPGGLNSPHLIIQPESMARCEWKLSDIDEDLIDEIFIDELDQVITQITSATFLHHPQAAKNYKKLEMFMRCTKHLHVASAHLTAANIAWIQRIRGSTSERVEIFWNKHKNLKNREMCISGSMLDIIALIKVDIIAGRRAFLASNKSIEFLAALAEILKHTNAKKPDEEDEEDETNEANEAAQPRILLLTRETQNTQEVQKIKDINDPVNGWGTYDIVICSPSIQSGVSFDTKNCFHSVYGIFGNFTNLTTDAAQMLNRVRHPINNKTHVNITMQNGNIGPRTVNGLVNYIKYNRKHLNATISAELKQLEGLIESKASPFGFFEFKKTRYFITYLQNTVKRNNNLTFYLHSFIENHYIEGYKLTEFNGLKHFKITSDIEEMRNRAMRANIRNVKAKLAHGNAEAIAAAVIESNLKIFKILKKMKSGKVTPEAETLSVKQHTITKLYDVEQKQSTKWFEVYGKKPIKRIYKNLKQFMGHETFKDIIKGIEYVEKQYIKKMSQNALMNQDGTSAEATDAILNGTIGTIKFKSTLATAEYVIDLLKIFKIKKPAHIDPTIKKYEFEPATIHKALCKVQNLVILNTDRFIKKLGKRKYRLDKITAIMPTHDNFNKALLEFVNGTLKSALGISIKKPTRRAEKYILTNKYIEDGIFNNVQNKTKYNESVPKIGGFIFYNDKKSKIIHGANGNIMDSDDDSDDE